MACLLKVCIFLAITSLIIQSHAATSETKIQVQPPFDHALKIRLESAHANLSISCLQDYSVYLQQLTAGATWALKMFDSSAKFESGVLKGSNTFWGFYSECIDALPEKADLRYPGDNSTVALDFSSKYCLSTIHLTREHQVIHQAYFRPICDNLQGDPLTIAVCAPSTCNEEDVGKIAALSLRESGCTGDVISTVCRSPIEPFFEDGPAITVAVLLATLAGVVLGATLYDCTRRKFVRNSETPPDPVNSQNNGNTVLHIGPPEPEPVNCAEKVLLCFSLLQNGKKAFGSDNSQGGSIRVLNGLRFFSMAMVILIHNEATATFMATISNASALTQHNLKTNLVQRGTLAIDTFFFIGGLVLSYSTLKQLHKRCGKYNWLMFYVHRYFRTVPLVMIVVAICAFLMRHFGDGPRWAEFLATFETNCRVSWWTYPLFVQNFVLLDQQCLAHTWYSAADFQIYLVSPPLLYVLYKKPRVGVFISAVLSIASITFSATYSSLMTVRYNNKDYDYYRDVYNKPYFRLSPYLLGMLMGLFLSKGPTVCPPKKRYMYLGWVLCAFCLLFPIYGYWICDPSLSTPWHGTFLAIASSVWAVGIAWIVYACVSGYGGIFTSVLASDALEPLSKLTFSTYIIHASVMLIFSANLEGSFYYSSFLMSYIFAGHLLLSYAISVIFCLFIELPISGLQKLLLGNK